MGFRRRARILAFQTLYRFDFTKETMDNLLDFSWMGEEKAAKLKTEVKTFARVLITGTVRNLEDIDKWITSSLDHWEIPRLARVDLANIRIGVFGLLYLKDVPPGVTIDEAVEIAKEFGADESYKFVNGILDNINKSLQKENK